MAGFTSLMDTQLVLSQGYGQATFAERHFPFSTFRLDVSDLENNAIELLGDTMVIFSYTSSIDMYLRLIMPVVPQTTTVPYLMNRGSSPEDPRWPSSPETPDAVSTPSTPLPGASASSKLPYFAIFLFD